MLYFYVDSARKAKKGVPEERYSPGRLYRHHQEAVDDERGHVLVVDTVAAGSPVDQIEELPKEAILNADPYLPTTEVVAGGGILTREGEKGLEVLLIFRKGRWDLPKGKQDPGESIKKCAKREVKEELGIDKVKVLELLDSTVHGYPENDVFVIKTTWWYLMKTTATTFVPQLEEKITDVRWYRLKKARKKLGHQTLIHLLERVEHKLR